MNLKLKLSAREKQKDHLIENENTLNGINRINFYLNKQFLISLCMINILDHQLYRDNSINNLKESFQLPFIHANGMVFL